MSSRRGDIAPLFKHFGGEQAQFKEIARDEDAHLAGERWPLLRDIPLRARTDPPMLSEEQRQGRRGGRSGSEEIEIAPPAESIRTGFASALNRLGSLRNSEVERASIIPRQSEPVAAKVEPARAAARILATTTETPSSAARPERSTTTFPSRSPLSKEEESSRPLNKTERSSGRLFAKKDAADASPTRTDTENPGGLFSRKTEVRVPVAEEKTGGLNDLFSRLEGGNRKEKERESEPKQTTGLFGRRKSR